MYSFSYIDKKRAGDVAIRYSVNPHTGQVKAQRLVAQVPDIQARCSVPTLGENLLVFVELFVDLTRGSRAKDHQHGGRQLEVFPQVPAQLRGLVPVTLALRHQGNEVAQTLTGTQDAGNVLYQRQIATRVVPFVNL